MKKTLSFLLALAMVFTMVQVGIISASALQDGYYTYEISGVSPNETATITGYTGSGGSVTIPGTLGGYTVTKIAAYAFAGCTTLTGVTIPDSVSVIEVYAFDECSGLTQFIVSSNNPSLSSQDGVLFNKTKTTLLIYPMGKSGIYDIPDSVVTIRDSAFDLCLQLTSLNIGTGVDTIGFAAIVGCSSMTQITVDSGNDSFLSEDGVLFNIAKTSIIAYPGGKSGATYTIPRRVTDIGTAFTYCTQLTSLDIPDSVNEIGKGAFLACTGLTTITLPESNNNFNNIDEYAFIGCTGLTSITIPGSVNSINNLAFYGCSSLANAYFLGNAPTTVGTYIFNDCASAFKVYYISGSTGFSNPWQGYPTETFIPLTTPTLSPSTTALIDGTVTVTITYPLDSTSNLYKIGSGNWTAYTAPIVQSENETVYARCIDANEKPSHTGSIVISNIIHPADFTYTFSGTNATITDYTGAGGNVTIPGTLGGYTVTGIAAYAFDFTALTSLILPDSVVNIEVYAFDECAELTQVIVSANNSSFSSQDGVLFNKAQTTLVFFPMGKSGSYDVPDSVITINDCAFDKCYALTSLNIGAGVDTIGFAAIVGSSSMTEITVDSGNDSFLSEDGVLFNLAKTSLVAYPGGKHNTTYSIPDGVTNIRTAFTYCTRLTSVCIPDSVTAIDMGAFLLCTGLTDAYFDGNAPTMGDYVFYYCASSFLIHYHIDKSGWTNPWYGYPTALY